MTAVFKFILALVTGSGGLVGSLERAYEARLKAANDTERLRLDEKIRYLEAQTKIRLATAGQPEMRLLAFLFGFPFALHVFLIGVGTCVAAPTGWAWLGWALKIPPFPPPYNQIEMSIIGFFFGYAAVTQSVKTVAAVIAGKAR